MPLGLTRDEKRRFDRQRYNRRHKAIRRMWARLVAQGGVRCHRGAECLFADGEQGGLIRPDEPWDLGHDAAGEIRGPEHRRCNRATARWTKPESPRSREW